MMMVVVATDTVVTTSQQLFRLADAQTKGHMQN